MALGNGWVRAYVARFSNAAHPDFVADFFSKATDVDLEPGDRLSLYFQHGMDKTLGNRKLGRVPVQLNVKGWYVDYQFKLNDPYEARMYKMAQLKKLGTSAGPAAHLVKRERVGKAFHLLRFPIKEASFTPIPVDYFNVVEVL